MNKPQQDLPEGGGALERFSIVVIGGGQAGLAAGYDLAQRGIDFVILERESRLGENWRPHWDSLRVFTPARFDGLPGLPFHGGKGRNLTKEQMSEYLEKYAERFGLPVQLGVSVLGLSADESGHIVVECEHRRIVAEKVIVATAFQSAPPRTTPGLEPRMIELRAGDYRTLSQLSQGGELVAVRASSTGLPRGASQCSEDAR